MSKHTTSGGRSVGTRAVLAQETSGSSMQLHARGLVIGVVTESAEAAEFIDDTFFPRGAFGVTIDKANTRESQVTIEDRVVEHGQLRELLDLAAEQMVAGEFEQVRNLRRPRYDADDGVTVFSLSDWTSGEPAALVQDGRRLVVVRTASSVGDRWLSRIARDIVTRLASAQGSLIVHSAAFALGDDAYLVVGDSGAGKSTTAIGLARLLEGAGWIGNDRIHLDADADGFEVTACPVALSVNKGTLDAIGVTGADSWVLQAGHPGPGSDWDQFMGEDKLRVSPREVERYLDVQVVASARLAGIIFPRVDRQAGFSFGLADDAFAFQTLERNYRSLNDNLFGEDWLGITPGPAVAPPSAKALLRELSRVPLLRCTFGNGDDLARLATELTTC